MSFGDAFRAHCVSNKHVANDASISASKIATTNDTVSLAEYLAESLREREKLTTTLSGLAESVAALEKRTKSIEAIVTHTDGGGNKSIPDAMYALKKQVADVESKFTKKQRELSKVVIQLRKKINSV